MISIMHSIDDYIIIIWKQYLRSKVNMRSNNQMAIVLNSLNKPWLVHFRTSYNHIDVHNEWQTIPIAYFRQMTSLNEMRIVCHLLLQFIHSIVSVGIKRYASDVIQFNPVFFFLFIVCPAMFFSLTGTDSLFFITK